MAIDNDALLVQIKEIKECSEENHRTLRGTNGESGLVGKVDRIEASVDTLKNNDLPHMEERIMNKIDKLSEKSVLWPSLAKGFLAPVAIAVVTALLVTLLHSWLF